MTSPNPKVAGAVLVVGLLLAGYGVGTMSAIPLPLDGARSTSADAPEAVVEAPAASAPSPAGAPSADATPSSEWAPDTSPEGCTGSVGAVQVSEVVVPEGATCSLDGTKVLGNVTVEAGSVLVARAVSVGGDVEAEGAVQVDLTGRSTVVGNVQVQRGGSSLIEETSIDGDLKWEEQSGPLVVRSSTMSGNLQADGNSGGVLILDNRVEGDLDCEENGPPPVGGGNEVLGGAEDCQLGEATPPPAAPSTAGDAQVPSTVAPRTLQPATPRAAPPPSGSGPLAFTVSSFNVLGSSHTRGTGKRPGMSSGPVRAGRAADLIRRHDAEVVGFQELQGDQLDVLRRSTGMRFFPGDGLLRRDSENSIGWRPDRWDPVERHTEHIPYFDGHLRAMPYVRLRNLETGQELWFANFHNPADTHRYHHQQSHRERATGIEARLVNRLVEQTGLPVIVTGDMNERADFYCRITASAPLVAARGGHGSPGCRPGRPRAVDWILGTPDIRFTEYLEDRSQLVRVTTDHPVISARVSVG